MVLLTEQIIGEQAGFEYWGDYPFWYGWEYPFFMGRGTQAGWSVVGGWWPVRNRWLVVGQKSASDGWWLVAGQKNKRLPITDHWPPTTDHQSKQLLSVFECEFEQGVAAT
jgi:hypothetical protein